MRLLLPSPHIVAGIPRCVSDLVVRVKIGRKRTREAQFCPWRTVASGGGAPWWRLFCLGLQVLSALGKKIYLRG